MHTCRWIAAFHFVLVVVFGQLLAKDATAEIRSYNIDSGGQFTYTPSTFLPISSCGEFGESCNFDIGGSFNIDFSATGDSASLVDLDLILSGVDLPNDPPQSAFVTADGVEQWLAQRFFQLVVQSIEPVDLYQDVNIPGLELRDHLNSTVDLDGGYDATADNGDAVLFDFSATQIPEIDGDFDLDGEVDGTDFLTWQQGYPVSYNQNDLDAWRNNYGGPTGGLSALGAVPEPTTLALAVSLTLVSFCLTRRSLR